MKQFRFTSYFVCVVVVTWSIQLRAGSAEQCGKQAGGELCRDGACCSYFGWCGNSAAHCGSGCQSQCDGGRDRGISRIINETVFNQFLSNRDSSICEKPGFYTYQSFIDAAVAFPEFGNSGDLETRKREIAAFLAQTAYLTAGDLRRKRDPYSWGYCYVTEAGASHKPAFDYCDYRYWQIYPCAYGVKYYGRGPMQLKWNYNYGKAADELSAPQLCKDPDYVAKNPTVSFRTSFWLWTVRDEANGIPSSHEVIAEIWTPSISDAFHLRFASFATVTNVLDGSNVCGRGENRENRDRIGFFLEICRLLDVYPGDQLSCGNQEPFVHRFFGSLSQK